ncbi:MAG TPA: amidohydrolase family protein [Spirochaetota bacterium]
MAKWSIQGAAIVSPEKITEEGSVLIEGDSITEVSARSLKVDTVVMTNDTVLCPGFINAHDHLIGNYYPKVGKGPYPNWLPWDNDLKSADVYRERQQIDNRDLHLLGGYRNLLSGVTSVHDHIPHVVHTPYLELMPLKVITRYTLAHSITPVALQWGEGIAIEHERAVKENIPFVTHCSEGFDEETVCDVATLNRLGALDEYSVLVHGLAFSKKDIELLKSRDVNVVWCADSNIFMFETTTDIKYLLEKDVNVSIGTDSPMSGGMNILEELRFDKSYYKKKYREDIPDKTLVRMVTSNPAKAFRLKRNGKVEKGYLADLTLVTRKGDPYASIVNAELKDVRLVVIDGSPVYGDASYADLFDSLDVEYQKLRVQGTDKIIVGDLLGTLRRIDQAVGFKKKFPFMPVDYDLEG